MQDTIQKKGNNEFPLLIFAFLLALAVRISWFYLRLRTSGFFLGPWNDDYCYNNIAQNILSGHGMVLGEGLRAYLPPVYPIFLSIIYSVFNNPHFAVWVQSILSAATCIVIYFVCKNNISKITGIVALVFSVLSPPLIVYNGWLLTESFYLFILSLFFYLIGKFISDGRVGNLIASSVIIGLAVLTRPQTFAFVILFSMWLFADSLRERVFPKNLLIFLVSFSVILAPWIARNYLVFHDFVPLTTHGGITFYHGNNRLVLKDEAFGKQIFNDQIPDKQFWGLPEVERDRTYGMLGRRFVMENLSQVPKLVLFRLWYTFAPVFFGFGVFVQIIFFFYWLVITPFSFLGMLFWTKLRDKHLIPALIFILSNLLIVSFFSGYFRLRISFEIPLIMFASYFWSEIFYDKAVSLWLKIN